MAKVNLTKSVKDRVEVYLLKHPHLRDDDGKLIANFWESDIRRLGFESEKISSMKFLELFANGDITHPESIRRVRADLQKNHHHLRGEKFGVRHSRKKEVSSQLGYTRSK